MPSRTAHAREADEGSPRGVGMGAKLVYATKQHRAFRGVSCSYSGSLDSRCRRVGACAGVKSARQCGGRDLANRRWARFNCRLPRTRTRNTSRAIDLRARSTPSRHPGEKRPPVIAAVTLFNSKFTCLIARNTFNGNKKDSWILLRLVSFLSRQVLSSLRLPDLLLKRRGVLFNRKHCYESINVSVSRTRTVGHCAKCLENFSQG